MQIAGIDGRIKGTPKEGRKEGNPVFGKEYSCRDCLQYGGMLSDGKPLCMKYGPLTDITCCRSFREKKDGDFAFFCMENGKEESGEKEQTVSRGNRCILCRFFVKKKKNRLASAGECMKFPGRVYNGEERSGCGFFETGQAKN